MTTSVSSTSSASMIPTTTFVPVDMKWVSKLNILDQALPNGTVNNAAAPILRLGDSLLGCFSLKECETLECRIEFLRIVIEDLAGSCPRDEELVVISLGSDNLLVEFLLAKGLFENGYKKVTFFPIEPSYRYSFPATDSVGLLKDFRSYVSTAYLEKWNEEFPRERIRCLSQANRIEKYFPNNHPNVLLIESLPSEGSVVHQMKKFNISGYNIQKGFLGSQFVPKEVANSLTFIPKQMENMLAARGATLKHALPFTAFITSNAYYIVDMGVKIFHDDTFIVSLFGFREYYQGELISTVEGSLKAFLEFVIGTQIQIMKKKNPETKLTQKQKTALLEGVKEGLTQMGLEMTFFYQADYQADRAQLVDYLSKRAGHHYRKNIIHVTDAGHQPKIIKNSF